MSDLRLKDMWSPVRRQRNKRELVGVLHNWQKEQSMEEEAVAIS